MKSSRPHSRFHGLLMKWVFSIALSIAFTSPALSGSLLTDHSQFTVHAYRNFLEARGSEAQWLALMQSSVAPVQRYVAPTGTNGPGSNCTDRNNPCQTIAYAIGRANAGDTINIAAGTYAELLVIDKALTLRGARFGAIAKGRTGNQSVLRPPTVLTASMLSLIDIQADRVVIDGFVFDLATSKIPLAINTTVTKGNADGRFAGLQLLNNEFKGNPQATDASAMLITYSDNLLMEGNYFYELGSYGAILSAGNSTDAATAGSTGAVFRNNDSYSCGKGNLTTPDGAHQRMLIENNRSIEDSMLLFNITSSNIRNNEHTAGASLSSRIYLGGGCSAVTIERNKFNSTRLSPITVLQVAGYATNVGITIKSNTINGTSNTPGPDAAETSSTTAAMIDFQDAGGTNVISDNSIVMKGLPPGAGNFSYGIRLGKNPKRSSTTTSLTGKITISGNILNGADAARTTGIQILETIAASAIINLTGNTVTNFAMGIEAGKFPNGADVNANFNRIFSHTDFGLRQIAGGGVTDATNNWWGGNFGPNGTGAGCPTSPNGTGAASPAIVSPWLMLTLNAAPNPMPAGGNATLTSLLTINSDRKDTSAPNSYVPPVPISFSASAGNVNPASGQTSNGKFSSIFMPAGTGSFNVSTVADAQTLSASLSTGCGNITVTAPAANTITTGSFFNAIFSQQGGATPVAFATSDALPTGMSLSEAGTLSGTPTQAGTFPITVVATDARGCKGSVRYTLTVNCPAINLTVTTLPDGLTGNVYNQTVTASPQLNYTWTITAGELPPGLSLNVSNGTISGTPTTAGTYNFSLTATAFGVCAKTQPYSIRIQTATLTINDVSMGEGDSGTLPMNFTVSLSQAGSAQASVYYVVTGNTATAGSDFVLTSGTASFTPGQLTQTIQVMINGDSLLESDETLTVTLSSPVNASIADDSGTGTILNDDADPTLSVNNPTVMEGNAGISDLVFEVRLSAPSDLPVSVTWNTQDGTATAGQDYEVGSGTLNFAPREIAKQVIIHIMGDSLSEGDETVLLRINASASASSPEASATESTNNSTASITGTGTIRNDDDNFGVPGGTVAGIMSDQKPGSVLIFPIYSSSSVNSATEDTRFTITNSNPIRDVTLHLFFVDGRTCAVRNSLACLTRSQTMTFSANDYDPDTTGYLIVTAVDAVTGCPINYNYLIGDETVKMATGHYANLAAWSFAALKNDPAVCNPIEIRAEMAFDGVSYEMVPRVLALDNFTSPADDASTMLVINHLGGNLLESADTMGSLFGLAYNDVEQQVSFSASGGCQLRERLTGTFPLTAPRLSTFIPGGTTGWMKFWSTQEKGLIGATLSRNSTTRTGDGHNLHALTFTATSRLIVPVFPPTCL